jgi:hypothetical protein
VDWEGQVMRLYATQTKGGDARVFPFGLAPELKQVLEERWAEREGLFVFHRDGRAHWELPVRLGARFQEGRA